MYLILFNAVTDAIEKMDLKGAAEYLVAAQQQAEECYIVWGE